MGAVRIIEAQLGSSRDSAAAFACFRPIISALSSNRSVLEIGAGRRPLFSQSQLVENRIDYTANDIDPNQLAAMPERLPAMAFDASKAVPQQLEGRFDLIFSKMVQEHVSGTLEFYKNIAYMLRPGGVALHFHPVLYAFPFVANLLMPEWLSEPILYRLRRDRVPDCNPKFPARYDHCKINDRVRARLSAQGYSQIHQIPFYGHGYYRPIPGIGAIHQRVTDFLKKRNFTPLATFSYTIGTK